MALWTDIVTPQELTGYARAALADYEASKGTLARWLPNRETAGIIARFVKGQFGLIDVARFRAYDAEPEIGKRQAGQRVTIEMPALGQNIPVSEYEQLRERGLTNEEALVQLTILNATKQVVQAVADAVERLRGIVIATGKATIAQDNFAFDDDFGRPSTHQLVAGSLWSTGSVSRLDYLQTITDTYLDTIGEPAGAIVMSNRVFRALQAGNEFQTQLINGAARSATPQQVRDVVSAAGFPDIFVYDRRVSVNGAAARVLPSDELYLLPAPVDPNGESALGATLWGQTLTSTDPSYGIEPSEQPGVVAGVYKNPKPPMGLEVISDAIALPVLANAALSLRAKVL